MPRRVHQDHIALVHIDNMCEKLEDFVKSDIAVYGLPYFCDVEPTAQRFFGAIPKFEDDLAFQVTLPLVYATEWHRAQFTKTRLNWHLEACKTYKAKSREDCALNSAEQSA